MVKNGTKNTNYEHRSTQLQLYDKNVDGIDSTTPDRNLDANLFKLIYNDDKVSLNKDTTVTGTANVTESLKIGVDPSGLNEKFKVDSSGNITGNGSKFKVDKSGNMDVSGNTTVSGLSSLNGGISVNSGNFVVRISQFGR